MIPHAKFGAKPDYRPNRKSAFMGSHQAVIPHLNQIKMS